MGKLTLKIVAFFYDRKAVFFICLLFISGFIGVGISRLKINQNIFSTLPKGKAFEQLNKLIENKNISNKVVFSLYITPKDQEEDIQSLLGTFSDSLKGAGKNYLTDIVTSLPDVVDKFYNYYYSNFPYMVDSAFYQSLEPKLAKDSINATLTVCYNQLVSPGSTFLRPFLINDPIFISGNFFKQLRSNNDGEGLIMEDEIVYTRDKKKVIVNAKTTFHAGSSQDNIALYHLLENFKARWDQAHPTNKMEYFGTFQIAAENAIQVKKDNKLTITLSVVCILVLLLLYYRKLTIPLYFFLPTIFGATFALGVMGFVKPEISAISLATAAVLLGIIVDYAFHFFTHLKHTRSIETTIKEISIPLFTGSFTTITALAALRFSNSVVLQDFGMIAAISLTAAAVFTLTGLPVILKIFKFDYANIPDEKVIHSKPSFFSRHKGYYMAMVIILTAILYVYSNKVKFDSDLENMSVHSEKLVADEEQLTGLNPKKEKQIYLFATDKSYDNACAANFNAFEKLVVLKGKGEIKSYHSTAQFLIPKSIITSRKQTWDNFWAKNRPRTLDAIHESSARLGLNQDAFKGFEGWIGGAGGSESANGDSLIQEVGLNNLVDQTNERTTLITTVVIKNEYLASVKEQLAKINGIEIFDRAEMANSSLELVKNDFNYIFWITASIVFFTLLVIYGRIELTLLAFLPMAISWTWILGIAGLLGIKFNFVNVVISTFVFGLGDDFSIFVTDGLLNKYKFRNSALGSYTSAIVLSATATMIGLGVLFFAQHPAIHSIAAISVLGIGCILFLSLTFQPILFDFFIQKRVDNKKAPIPLTEFVYSAFEFAYFIVVCLCFYIILALLYITPAPKKSKIAFINTLISFFAWTVIYFDLQVTKRIFGRENLDLSKPSILIANHTSFLDILLIIMLNKKIILMVNRWVYHSPLFGFFIRYAGYIFTETGAEENLELIKQRIADGYSILIFPEGTRSLTDKIQRFHKGAFYLSQELKLDITPVLIHGASYVLPKNDYIVKAGSLNLKILPRIKHDDPAWGATYKERCKNVTAHFRQQYQEFKNERENTAYLRKRVLNNYMFKGPVIEWYTRIKWKLENKNYETYNEIIGNRKKILDIGCGYGYLDFYLHYKNEAREIIGIDYDEEKVEIADNCFDKGENVKIIAGDPVNFDFGTQDVVFLNDVLHYLTAENQAIVLEKSYSALNENGVIFIRDGVTEQAEKHEKTKLTEYLSTKVFRFNKQENEFQFISIEMIRNFAKNRNLTFEVHEHSANTSNVLFILKKP